MTNCPRFFCSASNRFLIRFLCGSLFLLLATLGHAQESANLDDQIKLIESQRIEAVQRAIAPTVAVLGDGGEGGGSGVVISPDGYALTNFHVTSPFGTHMRGGMADGKLYPAVIVGVDATGDLALIKLLGRSDFPVATLGDSRKVQVGQWCFAIGNPFLLATNLQPSVSFGIISGVERYQYPAGTILEYADCIQTDAAINPGNSGGPLFNREGELIGINGRGSFEKRGRVNVGVGYAISINQVKNFVGALRGGRFVDHATLGATVATDDAGRVRITNILNSSDAYRRGLRYNNEILEIAGRSIRTTNELKNVLGTLPSDWRVKVRFRNSDGEQETLVRLGAVHTQEELLELVQGGLPGMGPMPKKPEEKEKQPAPDNKPADQESGISEAQPTKNLWKDFFSEKPGFANFHFNRLEKERVLKAYLATLGELPPGANWKITGELAGDNRPADFLLSDNSFTLDRAGLQQNVDPKQGLSKVIAKANLDGLTLALGVWRQLCLGTGNAQGNLLDSAVYLGTMPILGQSILRDVLEVQISDLKVRLYFNTEDGTLLCLEAFGDEGDDPVEVYFDKYEQVEGKLLPRQIRLQYGIDTANIFQAKEFKLDVTATTAPVEEESGS